MIFYLLLSKSFFICYLFPLIECSQNVKKQTTYRDFLSTHLFFWSFFSKATLTQPSWGKKRSVDEKIERLSGVKEKNRWSQKKRRVWSIDAWDHLLSLFRRSLKKDAFLFFGNALIWIYSLSGKNYIILFLWLPSRRPHPFLVWYDGR